MVSEAACSADGPWVLTAIVRSRGEGGLGKDGGRAHT